MEVLVRVGYFHSDGNFRDPHTWNRTRGTSTKSSWSHFSQDGVQSPWHQLTARARLKCPPIQDAKMLFCIPKQPQTIQEPSLAWDQGKSNKTGFLREVAQVCLNTNIFSWETWTKWISPLAPAMCLIYSSLSAASVWQQKKTKKPQKPTRRLFAQMTGYPWTWPFSFMQ